MDIYIPEQGDIVWIDIDMDPQFQRRPGIILTPLDYNQKIGLALLCPVTNQIKGYPFEISISSHLNLNGIVLSDQIKSVDWEARNAEYICKAPNTLIIEIVKQLNILLRPLNN